MDKNRIRSHEPVGDWSTDCHLLGGAPGGTWRTLRCGDYRRSWVTASGVARLSADHESCYPVQRGDRAHNGRSALYAAIHPRGWREQRAFRGTASVCVVLHALHLAERIFIL